MAAVECSWCGRIVDKRRRGDRRQVCSATCRAALREYDHGNLSCSWSAPTARIGEGQARRPRFVQGRCRWCGEHFIDTWLNTMSTRHCSRQCVRLEAKLRTRLRRHRVQITDVARADILDRDGWVCMICHLPIDHWRRSPELLAASIDHIVPVDHGGPHAASNLQAAHLVCNAIKSNGELPNGLVVRS